MIKLGRKNGNGKHACWVCSSHVQVFCLLFLVALIFVFGTLAAYLFEKTRSLTRMETANQTVTMIGEGIVSAKPTVALVQAGLETTANTVQEAVALNTKKMNEFLSQVSSFDIQERDRKTISYYIQPKYDYPRTNRWMPASPVLVGYTVLNTVQLKVRTIQKVGDMLGVIGAAGLNQVGSFSFVVDDVSALKTAALEAALANAQEKVAMFSATTGSQIGGILSFWEITDNIPPIPVPAPMMSVKAGESAMSPIMEPGEQDVKATVSVTYKIVK